MTGEQRRVVVTLGFCGFVSAADNWFVSPALPAIARALCVLPSAAAIILSAYLVPYGLLQPVCGAVGDRVGRVRLLHVMRGANIALWSPASVLPTNEFSILGRVKPIR